MEVIFEVLGELLIQIFGEVFVEIGLRSLGAPFQKEAYPIWAGFGSI